MLSAISCIILGCSPQWPPMILESMVSWAKCWIPRSRSLCPQEWTRVSPLGLPVSKKRCSMALRMVSAADTRVIPMVATVALSAIMAAASSPVIKTGFLIFV